MAAVTRNGLNKEVAVGGISIQRISKLITENEGRESIGKARTTAAYRESVRRAWGCA